MQRMSIVVINLSISLTYDLKCFKKVARKLFPKNGTIRCREFTLHLIVIRCVKNSQRIQAFTGAAWAFSQSSFHPAEPSLGTSSVRTPRLK